MPVTMQCILQIYFNNLSGEKEKSALPITAFTDSKSTLDAINSSTSVSDKKLRLEVAVLRQYQDKREIEVKKIKGSSNLSDVLTKRGASSKSLLSTISEGILQLQ